jgi:excisionase family DNA binding protein
MMFAVENNHGEHAMNEVFTVAEAAAMLKVDTSTLQRKLRAGTLGGFRIGTDWRIPKADLDAFIAGNRNSYRPGQPRQLEDEDASDRAALGLADTGDFENWNTVKARNGL